MKKLSKVIPHFKNAGFDKCHCRVCGDWWEGLWNKNSWSPKHKDYPSVKARKGGNGNEVNINIPKAPDGQPMNEENLLSNCTFKFLNKALKFV